MNMGKEISIAELVSMVDGRVIATRKETDRLTGTCPIDGYINGKVSFVKNEKYGGMLSQLHDAVVIIPEGLSHFCSKYPQNTYIMVKKDVAALMMDIQEFFYGDQAIITEEGISKTAKVDKSAAVGKGSYIGENVFIGKNVVIGENAKILHNSCILENVGIGKGTNIYPGVCIYKNCQIGNDCLIHSGARIGSDGFRFEQDIENKRIRKMYHVGNVIVGDRVEIGSNAAIDRATFESEATLISNDAKIDNLVHIGHNAKIGARTIVAALSCIGGSDRIGEDVWIGIGATISNGVKVGDRAKILLNAVVAYDVAEGEIVSGFYAMPHRQWKEVYRKLKGE